MELGLAHISLVVGEFLFKLMTTISPYFKACYFMDAGEIIFWQAVFQDWAQDRPRLPL